MKPRQQPIRKVSLKRLKQLSGNGISLHHNSTIRRKPCNATTAKDHCPSLPRYTDTESLNSADSRALIVSQRDTLIRLKPIPRQRKPVNKQSAKQKLRLQKLSQLRQTWWEESQEKGKPLICGICDEEIRTREELASDHEIPGTFRDDSKIQPAHNICNMLKGSRRNFKIVRGDRNWKLIHGLL